MALFVIVIVLVIVPFADNQALADTPQRTYSPDIIDHIDGLLEGTIPLTKQFMIENMTVTITTTIKEIKPNSYIIKNIVDHDGAIQPDLGLKYKVKISNGTYHVHNSDFNLMVTDTYDKSVTKSISMRSWVSGCGATVVLIGYSDGSNVGCWGHADVDAEITASTAFIGWEADSVYNWWIFTGTYERGYANIVGQEYEFNINHGSITISGTYSSTAQHNMGAVFFYMMD